MTVTFKNWKITATYTGSKAANWGGNVENWNHHTVTVTNTENGKRTRFDFWASIAKPELDSDYDIMNAFYCFVSDAIYGDMSFSDFCAGLGYDEDSRKAYKVWTACKRSKAKLERIGVDDVYALLDSLEDYA